MTYPVTTRKTVKKVKRYTTDLDDYEHEAAHEVRLLLGLDRAKLVRLAINNFVESFHTENSIGREPAQQDIFKCRKRG